MRLNPLKCAFAMEAGKFLGFMISQRGVKADPKKYEAILRMTSPGCVKDVQGLAGRLTALSRFLGASAAKALLFFNLMKKGIVFEWTLTCEEAFNHFKSIISAPSVLSKPRNGETLFLYLVVTDEALATVLVREEGKIQQTVYFARDSLLQKYLERVKRLSEEFDEVTVQHIPRERNTQADLLSKLASTKPGTGNRFLIQGLVKEPIVTLHITQAAGFPSWIDLIIDFLENGKLPDNDKTAKALRREAAKYTIIQGQIFKKGLSQPLLKCLRPDQTDYVLSEVHEGCYGHHIGGKALARKLVRAGYYWPSMMSDSKEFVKKCRRCQENDNFHKAPAAELSLLMASRSDQGRSNT
ncbi:uncharacterized protein [Arachis hypogaea]|uniref:uncharacterized protein n=1 Tax=Arachis hypogaea TaxID=3818 RepID=UPI003B21A37D